MKIHLFTKPTLELLIQIGMIHIQLNEMELANDILIAAFQAIVQLPVLEDKTLFVRVGYNYARVLYNFENYEEVIAIC